jgi:hypothetical protein
MKTEVAEIASGIFRLSTFVPDIAPPAGFTFNQFLITANDPMLFHCGGRGMFPLVSAAVSTIMPGRASAMDQLWTRRVRRMRVDEPLA